MRSRAISLLAAASAVLAATVVATQVVLPPLFAGVRPAAAGAEFTAVHATLPDESPTASPDPDPVDTQPPVTVAHGADELWHNRAVKILLEATDDLSGVAATFYSLDGGPWVQGTELVVRAPADHSNDGVHVLLYASVDEAGNREEERQAKVKIDTTPPRFSWVSVSPRVIYSVQSVTFTFTIRNISGPVSLTWRMYDQYGTLVAKRTGLERKPGTRTLSVSPRYPNGNPLMPGLYRVRLRLVDAAGNVTVTSTRAFRNYRSVQPRVWRRVDGAGMRVALTFDDGNTTAWRSILDTLKAHRARATFFPLGPYAAAAPGLMRRTRDEGHGIGSHGWTHRLMTSLSYSDVRAEVLRSQVPWWDGARVTPVRYVRPPYGAYNTTTLAALGSAGYARVIIWDVDPQDWRDPGASVIVSRVLSNVRPGSIVVLHMRSQTATALPAIIRGLRARGYDVVSLPELFRAAGYR